MKAGCRAAVARQAGKTPGLTGVGVLTPVKKCGTGTRNRPPVGVRRPTIEPSRAAAGAAPRRLLWALPHQAFFDQTLHQPLALTALPAKIAQPPVASPALPRYTAQVLHIWVAACFGNLA